MLSIPEEFPMNFDFAPVHRFLMKFKTLKTWQVVNELFHVISHKLLDDDDIARVTVGESFQLNIWSEVHEKNTLNGYINTPDAALKVAWNTALTAWTQRGELPPYIYK